MGVDVRRPPSSSHAERSRFLRQFGSALAAICLATQLSIRATWLPAKLPRNSGQVGQMLCVLAIAVARTPQHEQRGNSRQGGHTEAQPSTLSRPPKAPREAHLTKGLTSLHAGTCGSRWIAGSIHTQRPGPTAASCGARLLQTHPAGTHAYLWSLGLPLLPGLDLRHIVCERLALLPAGCTSLLSRSQRSRAHRR